MASRTTSGRGWRVIADLGAKGVIAYPASMPRFMLLGDSRLGGRTSVIALDGREVVPSWGRIPRCVRSLQRVW